jgi:hypothetical protein
MSRRLPLVGSPSHASHAPPAAAHPLAVDLRCFALVCEAGIDASAAWLSAFAARYAELGGAAVPVGLCCAAPPVGAAGRAVAAGLVSVAVEAAASAFAGLPHWVLVTDAGFAPDGARLVVRLCDPMGARRSAPDLHRQVLLAHDRLATARALAGALAARTAPSA